MELERLSSETGSSYESLVEDYDAKLTGLRNIERNIEAKHEELQILEHKDEDEQKRAKEALASITSAIVSARDNLENQKRNLQAEFREYLAQNKLSWQRIKLVEAVIDAGLNEAGLTQRQKEMLRNQIRNMGSMLVVIKQLEQKRDRLNAEANQLFREINAHQSSMKESKEALAALKTSIAAEIMEEDTLTIELDAARVQLQRIEQEVSQKVNDLYICRLILGFLFNRQQLSDEDLDRLVSMMVALRQERLGIRPRRTKVGAIIYTHELPKIYTNVKAQQVDSDFIRAAFAFLLTPLFKDKLVSRIHYDMLKSGYEVVQRGNVTEFKAFRSPATNNLKPIVIRYR